MSHVCAYRAAGNDAAAKAAYEEWRRSVSPTGHPDVVRNPEWEGLSSLSKEGWRDIFRAGHRAYRQVIVMENFK